MYLSIQVVNIIAYLNEKYTMTGASGKEYTFIMYALGHSMTFGRCYKDYETHAERHS